MPPILEEWHEGVVKMFHETVENNKPMERTASKMTPKEYKALIIDCEERSVKIVLERYEERKKDCQRLSDFLSAAVERYGEPPQGIKVEDSLRM